MTHIFYFLALLPIFWEMMGVTSPRSVKTFLDSIREKRKENFNVKSRVSGYTNSQKTFSILMLGYSMWAFTGLFGSQWVLFIMIILMGLVPKKLIVIQWLDSFITLIILAFMVINVYHLHIDLWGNIKPFIIQLTHIN